LTTKNAVFSSLICEGLALRKREGVLPGSGSPGMVFLLICHGNRSVKLCLTSAGCHRMKLSVSDSHVSSPPVQGQ